MKRSGIERKTRIRRRSKRNSRAGKDEALRREYVAEQVDCELCPHLGPLKTWRCFGQFGLDPHHIFGGTRSRHDVKSNLIAICRLAHDWCQERNIIAGKIVCLWVKHQKNELDLDELRAAAGQSIPAWVERHVVEDPRVDAFRLDLLEAFE